MSFASHSSSPMSSPSHLDAVDNDNQDALNNLSSLKASLPPFSPPLVPLSTPFKDSSLPPVPRSLIDEFDPYSSSTSGPSLPDKVPPPAPAKPTTSRIRPVVDRIHTASPPRTPTLGNGRQPRVASSEAAQSPAPVLEVIAQSFRRPVFSGLSDDELVEKEKEGGMMGSKEKEEAVFDFAKFLEQMRARQAETVAKFLRR